MAASVPGHYHALEIESMSPAKRIVYLYGFLLGQLNQAQRHIAEGEHEARNKKLMKAQDVVHELLVSLNREEGGEIANNLAAIYGYWLKELLHIDVNDDAARLERLKALVSAMHQTWTEAAESYDRQTAPPNGSYDA